MNWTKSPEHLLFEYFIVSQRTKEVFIINTSRIFFTNFINFINDFIMNRILQIV